MELKALKAFREHLVYRELLAPKVHRVIRDTPAQQELVLLELKVYRVY